MNYFIYCRKSSEDADSQALSLPAQMRVLTQLADDKKLFVVDTIEESKSAKTPNNRPLFRKMLNQIYANKAQGLIVWHVNRLARNPMEAGELQQMLVDGKIKEIITPDETITKENANDIILGVKFGEASQYSKDLSKNVKRGIREKMLRGQYPNRAPSFYVNTGTGIRKDITPDPLYRDTFKQFVKWFKETSPTLAKSAEWLNDKGALTSRGNLFYGTRMSDILKNPVYAGYMRIKDEPMIKGAWEPLMSLEDYKIIRSIIGERYVGIKHHHEKGYKQLILCGHCGCSITCSHKVKNGVDYIYYHCTGRRGKCAQPILTEKNLEEQILKQITRVRIDNVKYNQLIQMTRDSTMLKQQNLKKNRYGTVDSITSIDEQKSLILDLYLTKSLNRKDYDKKLLELDGKLAKIKEQHASKELDYDEWFRFVQEFYTKCRDITSLYADGDMDERTQILKSIGWNFKMVNGNLGWNFQNPWAAMVDVGLKDESNVLWGVTLKVGTFIENTLNALINPLLHSSNSM